MYNIVLYLIYTALCSKFYKTILYSKIMQPKKLTSDILRIHKTRPEDLGCVPIFSWVESKHVDGQNSESASLESRGHFPHGKKKKHGTTSFKCSLHPLENVVFCV